MAVVLGNGLRVPMNDPHQSPDTEWLRRVMEEHEGVLLRYVVSLTRDLDRARDVVQDAFLRLCEQPPGQLEGRVAPWLFRVARNRVIDQQRKDSRMRSLEDADLAAAVAPEPSPASAAEARDDARTAFALLGGLTPQQQEVVRLKFQNQMSYEEIAAVTSLSVSHVGVILHHALRALRGRYRAIESDLPAA